MLINNKNELIHNDVIENVSLNHCIEDRISNTAECECENSAKNSIDTDGIIKQFDNCINGYNKKRELDNKIFIIQNKLKEGTKEEKDEIFSDIYNDFRYFIKNQTSNLFLIGAEPEDLVQEATISFYQAILDYDINKGAFIFFAKMYIRRKILSLIEKSLKYKKHNISFISLDGISSDDCKSNYEDYIYYNMSEDCDNLGDGFLKKEQYTTVLDQVKDVLTEKEKNILYLYLKGSSYENIAHEYDICEKSVDNALYRAKIKMKEIKSITSA